MESWLRRTPLVAVAVAVLAGCTTSGDATRVLGDLATIQPCGLTDPEVFAEFGSAEFGPPESLDYCTVVVKPGASETDSLTRKAAEEVTIMVGELARPSADPFLPTDKLEDVNDSIYTTKPDDVGVSCWQTLVFAEEDLALSVRSRMGPTAKPVPTCDMVTAGMAKVVEVILAGKVEHRSPAKNSLIALDPCDLVSDETVTALPGFAEARRVDKPNRHQCYWRTPGMDGPGVKVTFGVAKPPEPSNDFDGNSDPIAGRPSITTDTGGFCTVETGHIPFEEVMGTTGLVETVAVDTDVPSGRGDDENDQADSPACEGALAIARALWPRLPSA
ncbi:DUF3558 family protein [Actinophytocola sp.]|uniref:DUF3558 family protein n=1 Tax=Actinophytocola sp. TaxID=1872138 RepID=UPI002ED153DA